MLLGFVGLGLALGAYLWGIGNPSGAVAFSLVTPISAICYLVLRRDPGTIAISTHVICTVLFALSVYLAWRNTGGLGAPVLVVLPIIPLLAAFLIGPRSAIFWGVICALTPLGFWVANPYVPPVSLTPEALLAVQAIAPVLAVLIILGLALSYEKNMALQREALRRATEEAVQASRAKSAFLASMSHEIRTPLGGVLGLAELLHTTELKPEQARMVELLDGAGRSLLSLLTDVLDFSRVEAGAMKLDLEPMDLRQLAQDVTGLLGRLAVDKGIGLKAVHHGPAWVVADPLRMRQILLNLVSNAIKFTHDGQVVVSVSTAEREGLLQVQLSVKDTGPGISKAAQARLFQPFTQEDEGISRRYGGSGLGLAIVLRLVELMDGQVRIESEPGLGTEFIVDLRLEPSEAVQPQAVPTHSLTPGLRILLAEDNPVNQQVVTAMLRRLGCEVSLAENGLEAIDMAMEIGNFDAVLMDCQMPGMSGIEAAQTLRAQGYAAPIIALTANVTTQDRQACAQAGMDGFLPKPLSLRMLSEELGKL